MKSEVEGRRVTEVGRAGLLGEAAPEETHDGTDSQREHPWVRVP